MHPATVILSVWLVLQISDSVHCDNLYVFVAHCKWREKVFYI